MNSQIPKKVIVRATEYKGQSVWGVFAEGDGVAAAVFTTKRHAVSVARNIARGTDVEVTIEGAD